MSVTHVAELTPAVNVDQANLHLRLLHGRATQGVLSFVLLGDQHRERHAFYERETALERLDDVRAASSKAALQDVVDSRWNVYLACSSFARRPTRGRGTRTDVLEVPGVWADLDVKPGIEGCFQDTAELLAFLRVLPPPTLEVDSGSGGRHAYWLLNERLAARAGQELLTMWLDFLRQSAAGYAIDHVHDTTRILRLAGSVRWPKVAGADHVTMPRQVVITELGPHYEYDELAMLAQPAHEYAKELRAEARRRRSEADEQHRRELIHRGLELDRYDALVGQFNVVQDWAALLEPTGWTLYSDQRGGAARCRYWTRPGKSTTDGKSAATDFLTDDGITTNRMTIYTNDPALRDLWENLDSGDAHGLCSKYQYALKRMFHGDEAALLRAIVAGGGSLT